MNKRISCIILACDSHITKGFSIFHSLLSVVRQDYLNVEIIIVENSHSKPSYVKELKRKFCKWNESNKGKMTLKFINNTKSLSRGAARNIGLEFATGNIIIFLDDDTILLGRNYFSKIIKLSSRYDYGYGANRYWTSNKMFQKKHRILLKLFENNEIIQLRSMVSSPSVEGRQDDDSAHYLSKTFIGNFGFVKANLIKKVGGFPNFNGYGYEDDFLMFKLYKSYAKMVILDDMEVIHVNHKVCESGRENFILYFKELVRSGFYGFNIIKTLISGHKREEVLEPLKVLHFDSRVESMFEKYRSLLPINLYNSTIKQKQYCKDNYILSKLRFVQLLFKLENSPSIDDFISNSSADFDNLANIISIALDFDFIKMNGDSKITYTFGFQYTSLFLANSHVDPKLIPKNSLNQFPCNMQSRRRRYNFIKERYPYVEYLKFAIIGDDDFLSLEFINDYWAWPVIIEKDSRITRLLRSVSDRFMVYDLDVADNDSLKKLSKVQTFITDPPYTLDGALAFIFFGLSMLVNSDDIKEFYVILNPAMMGRKLFRLQKILANANIILVDVINNFSQYNLPTNYVENKRAGKFSVQHGIKKNSIKTSSSSNMYIFSTVTPDLQEVRRNINYNKMYNHYDN
ncbi:MAG: bis-aminopropyl spermidine synthase family protein [Candidatus Komeilibacteria bacterium]